MPVNNSEQESKGCYKCNISRRKRNQDHMRSVVVIPVEYYQMLRIDKSLTSGWAKIEKFIGIHELTVTWIRWLGIKRFILNPPA